VFFTNRGEEIGSKILTMITSDKLMINNSIRIFKTNWVNLLAIFLATYLFNILVTMSRQQDSIWTSLSIALFGGLFGIIAYGAIFWAGFLLLIFIFDLLLFKSNKAVTAKLILEWFLISIPFAYWLIEYQEWVFLVGLLAFLIGQFIRKPKIISILLE
jgi:hypothetical protein